MIHNRVRDLTGQTLLNLQATGENFGDAREFGEADEGLVREVGDVDLLFERKEGR